MLSLSSFYLLLVVFIVVMLYIAEAIWRTRKTFKYMEAKVTWLIMGLLIYMITLTGGIFLFVYAYNKWVV